MSLSNEAEFVEWQLARWPEARQRYVDLGRTARRPMQLGGLRMALQHNPARIVSTGAKTDKASVSKRPCFLCAKNRPAEQEAVPIIEGWELLVNPFPIFPIHFTIASADHRPQSAVPAEIASLAEELPGLAVFYNGSRAGASAPDHLHLQAVLKDELPLLNLVESLHPVTSPGILSSADLSADNNGSADSRRLPFLFYSSVITPDAEGMKTLVKTLEITGTDPATGLKDSGLVNALFWIDGPSGLLRAVMIPRRAHRPSCYPADPSAPRPGEFLISPGAIDMAGVMIVPRKEDFDNLTQADILRIYGDVAESPN